MIVLEPVSLKSTLSLKGMGTPSPDENDLKIAFIMNIN